VRKEESVLGKSATGLIVLAVLGVLAISATPASAGMITVETAFDELDLDPNCSLREAVQAANTNGADANPGCADGEAALDTIVFSGQPFAQIVGTGDNTNATGDLDIPAGGPGGPLRIDGSAMTSLKQILSVGGVSNVVHLQSGTLTIANVELVGGDIPLGAAGTVATFGTLTLENAKVSGGTAEAGGGIAGFGSGALTLINTTVSGNTADGATPGGGILHGGGGGIYMHFGGSGGTGSLTLTNSVVSGNHATNAAGSGGGGIFHNGSGTLAMTNSLVTGNDTAGGSGGGILAGGLAFPIDDVTISGSTISGNDATGGAAVGGLAYVGVPPEKLRVIGSTITDNSAASGGLGGVGGVRVYGDGALVNSTISGNMAPAGNGGGLLSSNGVLAVVSSTVVGNTAATGAGAYAYDGTLALRNSIVASGASACAENAGMGGDVVSVGFNVDEGTSCDLGIIGDIEGVSAGLGPLLANGGPTMTHAIGPGSPAIDRVTVDCTDDLDAVLTVDQRGLPRTNGACDSGAFELQPPPPAPPATQSGGTQAQAPGSAAKKCKKKKKKRRSAATAKKKKCKKKKRR
jgi:CSLREA domain-containing protein